MFCFAFLYIEQSRQKFNILPLEKSSLFVMKVNKIRVNMEEFYSGLLNMSLPAFSKNLKHKTKCRVCMQDGDIPIASVKNTNEMIEALHIFGNIEIDMIDDVENPTHMCYVCYKFLKSAILFKKVAHRTNETLRRPILKQSPDHLDDYDYNLGTYGEFEDNKPNKNYPTKDLKYKEEPVKKGSKLECPICKKLFVKGYYNLHLKLHNPNLPDEYVCDICGKGFKLKKVYRGHMERHQTRYIFKCDLCPYVCRYKARLSMHKYVHTGELKFLCNQCPARYVTKSRLKDHIKLKHTKPEHKCKHCVKAFHNTLNLQRHINAKHLGIKNHECDQCGKKFSYRKKMLEHLRITHNTALRPYVKRFDRKTVKQQ